MNSKNSQDLNILFKEHSKAKANKEVNSPYAKYNSKGQLMCLVCGLHIKSAIIWRAHEKKLSHKDKLAKLIEKQKQLNAPKSSTISKNEAIPKHRPKGILKNSTSNDSPKESDEDSDHQMEVYYNLPIKNENQDQSSHVDEANTEPQPAPSDGSNAQPNSLPEGFFDDPVQDAKARKVEYRDKDAEEWQAFMKEVSAVEVESQQIIAQDKEEAAVETQIEQANEQIRRLERVVELDQEKKDQLVDRKDLNSAAMSEDSSDEEFSPLIWRTKNSLI